mmetsp:Transcript_60651/g.161170  ORF Transcript_60651/g.161170 Transcript_60651/m.161170 type:complete len:97 (+) Transcript_60651:546-836(+)
MQWPGQCVQQLKTARRVQHLKNTFERAVCFKGSCASPLHQDFKWRLLAPLRVLISDLATEFSRLAMVLARNTPHPTFTSEGRMKTIATGLPFVVGA